MTAVAVDPEGHVFVADFYNNRIHKFDRSGRFLTTFGRTGGGDGEMWHPYGVAVAEDGTVFVSDFANHLVQVWRARR